MGRGNRERFEALFPVEVPGFRLAVVGETRVGRLGLEGKVKLTRFSETGWEPEEDGLLLPTAWLDGDEKLITGRLDMWTKTQLAEKLRKEPWRGPLDLMPWRLGDAWKVLRDEQKAFRAFRETRQPMPLAELKSLCLVNMDLMLDRFAAVSARFTELYGLKLPRHVAVGAAFFRSLTGPAGWDVRSSVNPSGLLSWFEDRGLDRTARDGVDARVDYRYRCDMPEFVTVMSGDSDGLHWGLWYDDPRELPAQLASNYARDSAETFLCASTTVGAVREHFTKYRELKEREEKFTVRLLDEFIDALAPMAKWAAEERLPPEPTRGKHLVGSPGLALPKGVEPPDERFIVGGHEALRDEAAMRPLIAEAMALLAEGKPAAALALGRALHWSDADFCREDAGALLVGAYEALGFAATAGIARSHLKHRDLPNVGVLGHAPPPS